MPAEHHGARAVTVIQARMGSGRFPGKMLAEFNGRPILAWVLDRCGRASEVDETVLATSENERDDRLAVFADQRGFATHRGSEDDVLGRIAGAARAHDADIVVRVCADNPLIDPDVIDCAVATYREGGADYVYNHIPRGGSGYPDGLGAEVLGARTLFEIERTAPAPAHREHVTAYVWDNPDRYAIHPAPCRPEWAAGDADIRLDVDTPEDLARLNEIYADLPADAPAREIIDLWNSFEPLKKAL